MKQSNDVTSTEQVDKTVYTQMSSVNKVFPIIGIGSSAGGLEALEQFLSNIPGDCGMAFIVVQHLDPNHKDMMSELLQRGTSLKVLQITDHLPVKPNHVYVIPPAYDLTILNDVLLLLPRIDTKGLHLPIDDFFASLALDKKEHSIGVILSGMGSDGSLGVIKIKQQGGAVFVQSVDTAKYEGMPISAIDTGQVDAQAPAEELIDKIMAHIEKTGQTAKSIDSHKKECCEIEKVIALMRANTGHDFSLYKKSTILRRIERRMELHQLAKVADYVRYLRANPQETDLLFSEVLIGVTNFFRDKCVWQKLESEVISVLLSQYPDGGTLRAWVPACSTGEEAYTLAIVFQEAIRKVNSHQHFDLQIFATDLDNESVKKARKAIYPNSITENVSPTILERYFVPIKEGYKISKSLRQKVIFSQQSLIMDPPFTKLDLISCRNLFIYLEAELQQKLIALFHYSLNSVGFLILGMSETIGEADQLFLALEGKQRIYKRRNSLQPVNLTTFPTQAIASKLDELTLENFAPVKPENTHILNLENLANSLLHDYFAPSAVLTTKQADIVYISGKTGKYLEPAVGKVNHNLFAMARQGLSAPLNEVFYRALRQNKKLELRNIEIGTLDETLQVDVSVQPVLSPAGLSGMVLVIFSISAVQLASAKINRKRNASQKHNDEIETLQQVLQLAREELRMTTSEMQFIQENLKSANEELKSTNEELQSTNEELTTSKEEMQSMNEELQTVNHELNTKVSELSEASDDMENLLNSTNIATLFLDKNLKVRRFTTEILNIFKLISSDVGRPITDLVSSLIYPELVNDCHEVLRSLIFHEEEVTTHDGRWYIVRIMPYRTQESLIDGVVITFSDNTVNRKANIAMTKSESRFRLLFENSVNAVAYKRIILKDGKAVDFNYLEVNNAYVEITNLYGVVGKNGSVVIPNILQSNPDFMAVCGRVAKSGISEKIEYYVEESKQWFVCSMHSEVQELFVCVTENITDKKKNISTLADIKQMLEQGSQASKFELQQIIHNVQAKLNNLLILDE
ncbi:chemotaxis protein CheB [Shewanella aestuarii]|uniref:protein-glutamate O-methyltransferase n=1 Tax=Shewanella aestuarii TaxID=1028752 RepID=A0A6G9QM77_9GAMM|nr:chemotaxis protein CheB [Shewanella aestuarii]QIR15694.1 chemotaxis protein CheB [Shewanella aestuarii]